MVRDGQLQTVKHLIIHVNVHLSAICTVIKIYSLVYGSQSLPAEQLTSISTPSLLTGMPFEVATKCKNGLKEV